MRKIHDAVEYILKHDPLILAILGFDNDNSPKIYEGLAKKDSIPPLIVWQFVGGPGPQGTFHDMHAIEQAQFQVTSWGRSRQEAWQVSDFVQEAFEIAEADIELAPYQGLRFRRLEDSADLLDQDTGWIQVPTTYEMAVAR